MFAVFGENIYSLAPGFSFSFKAGKLPLPYQSVALLFSFAPAESGCAPFLVLQGQTRMDRQGVKTAG